MRLLGIDSMGKMAKKSYCGSVCTGIVGVDSAPEYHPGKSLLEIMTAVTGRVKEAGQNYNSVVIVSMANKIEKTPFAVWRAAGIRSQYEYEIQQFAAFMRDKDMLDVFVVFGGDPSLWPGYSESEQKEYLQVQSDVFSLFEACNIRTYSGCELFFSGGLEKFRGHINEAGHILGEMRWEACEWLESVLRFRLPFMSPQPPPPPPPPPPQMPVCSTQSTYTHGPHPELLPPPPPMRVSPSLSSFMMDGTPTPSRPFRPPVPRDSQATVAAIVLRDLRQMPRQICKQQLCEYVEQNSTNPCEHDNFPSRSLDTHFSHTVLICTSGSGRTQLQTETACRQMASLGWRPIVVYGLKPEDRPPKSWKIGCLASVAWQAALMPKILHFVGEHLRPEELLLVAEDSVWPTDACTPTRVSTLHDQSSVDQNRGLWLGAARGPHNVELYFGDANIRINTLATNGCKLIAGTGPFWFLVDEFFQKLDKNWTSDCVFQLLTGIGKVKMIDPFLAVSNKHFSERCHYDEGRSQFQGEVKDRQRPIKFEGALLDS